MARYKAIDTSPRFLAADLEKQLLPGSFEHAVHQPLDHEFELSRFDSRYRNDQNSASGNSAVRKLITPLLHSGAPQVIAFWAPGPGRGDRPILSAAQASPFHGAVPCEERMQGTAAEPASNLQERGCKASRQVTEQTEMRPAEWRGRHLTSFYVTEARLARH